MAHDPTVFVLLALCIGFIGGAAAMHLIQPYCCRLQPVVDETDAEADK